MAILLGSVDICIKTKPQKRCTEKIFLLVLLVFSMALAMKTVRINAIELESESMQSEESLISGKKIVLTMQMHVLITIIRQFWYQEKGLLRMSRKNLRQSK